MMNRIVPIILFAAAAWIAVGFVKPEFADIGEVRSLIESRKQTLANAERVIERRDKLMEEYASVNETDEEARLNKLLPDRIDTAHIALDLSVLAKSYGLAMDEVSVDDSTQAGARKKPAGGAETPEAENAPSTYESLGVNIVLRGSYDAFVAFLGDIERSLRILDTSSLGVETAAVSEDEPGYRYSLLLRTYRYMP